MNSNINSTTAPGTDRHPQTSPIAEQPRRLRMATLLSASAPAAIAIMALAAAPLAASVPVASSSGTPHVRTLLGGDPCQTTVSFGFNTMKLPTCAGD